MFGNHRSREWTFGAFGTLLSLSLVSSQARSQAVCAPFTPADPAGFVATAWQDVIIVDPAAMSALPLATTLQNILVTGGVPSPTPSQVATFLQTLIGTLAKPSRVLENSGVLEDDLADPTLAALNANDLLSAASGLQPLALTNRIDLAPADWSYCGEYRIVYGRNAPIIRLIFEAALPNPAGAGHPEGCQAVAKFWAGLGSTPAGPALTTALKSFYYDGSAVPGQQPVVHATHYGNPFGQVRSDTFGDKWRLREWHILPDPLTGNDLAFAAVPLAENALPALYAAPEAGTDPATAARNAARAVYQSQFATAGVDSLLSVDRAFPLKSPVDLVGGMGISVDARSDAYVSKSAESSDNPATQGSPGLGSRITARLATAGNLACQITAQHILNRAHVMSCEGCHNPSNGAAGGVATVAPGVNWPASLGFTHVDPPNSAGAAAELSPALKVWFLPFRREVLTQAVNLPANPAYVSATAQDSSLTTLRAVEANSARPASPEMLTALRDARDVRISELRARDSLLPGAFVQVRRSD